MNSKGVMRLFADAIQGDAQTVPGGSGTTHKFLPEDDDTVLWIGNGTYSWDVRLYGNASTAYLLWDASASKLSTEGAAVINVTDGQLQLSGTAITATAAEINAAADAGSRFVNVTDAASYTVLAANSGKIHIMPNFTATCTIALPAVAAGLEYTFISKAIAIDAQDWKIQSASATNFFLGGVAFCDTDAGAGADEISAGVFSNGTSNDFLNVVTPGGGTRIHIICDGTNWIVNGIVFSATTPAFADT